MQCTVATCCSQLPHVGSANGFAGTEGVADGGAAGEGTAGLEMISKDDSDVDGTTADDDDGAAAA